MKKLLSIILSIVMLVTSLTAFGVTALANKIEEAPVIAVGESVSISFNSDSLREENTQFYVKFVPEATDDYEFTLSKKCSAKDGMIIGMILDEDEAPFGDGAIVSGSMMGQSLHNLTCAGRLKKGKTYYLLVTGSDSGKYTADVTVSRGHTHSYETVSSPAYAEYDDFFEDYYQYDGGKSKVCYACGDEKVLETYYYPKTVTLSKSTYTYDGKAKQPKVTVKDRKGNTISSSNYTVKYKNNKSVGKATVRVIFKGNKYSGELDTTFVINPKGTKVSKVTAKKKGFQVKWNKQATQTSGYQIQYSTDKNFKKNNKTVTVTGARNVSKTITDLKGGKKYYVRVRTYKTVDKKKYYSSWSGSKAVTTKR